MHIIAARVYIYISVASIWGDGDCLGGGSVAGRRETGGERGREEREGEGEMVQCASHWRLVTYT